jgi:UDP-N-acetylmuramoyl-L-alanyl-D-glutamate--2,6-diaminopimelate ligase
MRGLLKKLIPTSLFHVIEPYGHLLEAVILNMRHGFPARGFKVVGVTGTNGKTSTAFLIYKMLQQAGYKVGLMTTVAYGAGEDIRPQIHHMTNVPVGELMQRLKWMRRKGVEWLVLETTSHALAQHRVWGVPYSVAVMTNVTHEHMAYHKTFERYRDAKVRLFKLAARNRLGLRTGIVNADDPSWRFFADVIPNVVTYGLQSGELQATHVHSTPFGSDFEVNYKDTTLKLHVNLPGSFNVENALAAAAAGVVIGLTDKQIATGISALESVEGRMTRIEEGQDFEVIVDYAHSPDSFEKLFKDLRPVVTGRIIALFGSLGGGDKDKRPLQGELAGRYCDEVVICEEDDRTENPEIIMNDIAAGAEKAGKVRDKDLFLVHDRPQAIQLAISRAEKGETVLLLGKGHEKTIERADGEHPWDEIAAARKALRSVT